MWTCRHLPEIILEPLEFPDFKDEYFGSSRALKVVFALYFRALRNIQGPKFLGCGKVVHHVQHTFLQ